MPPPRPGVCPPHPWGAEGRRTKETSRRRARPPPLCHEQSDAAPLTLNLSAMTVYSAGRSNSRSQRSTNGTDAACAGTVDASREGKPA